MVAGRGVALPYGVLIGAFRQERQCRPSDGLAGGSPLFSLDCTENHPQPRSSSSVRQFRPCARRRFGIFPETHLDDVGEGNSRRGIPHPTAGGVPSERRGGHRGWSRIAFGPTQDGPEDTPGAVRRVTDQSEPQHPVFEPVSALPSPGPSPRGSSPVPAAPHTRLE